MLLNGACYIRVSTDDQTEYSPDAQLKLIKKYAKQNDIILTREHIYIDQGISGKRAEKRPQFMHMIATAKTSPKPFDVILVHKFDRFARSREDSVVYKSLLRKEHGIKVISISESIEDDKFSIILEALLEAMAEYYSLNLAEEVKKGMTEKAGRGEYQSTPPFGYALVEKQLVQIPEEADLIRFAFEKFADNEINMRNLAICFNDMGIRTHRGNKFEARSFEYIFNNPVYIGKVRWTPTHRRKRYDYNNPDTIIAEGAYEPIIDLDTWNEVQERLAENREIYRRRENAPTVKRTWLSGLAKCANCGKTLIVQGDKYLQCNGYVKAQCLMSCHIKYSLLEELVLERLKEAFDGNLEITTAPRVPKERSFTGKTEYEMLNHSLEKIEDKELRVKLAYQDGIDSLAEYKENKQRLDLERSELIKRLQEVKGQPRESDEVNEETYSRIMSVYELLSDPNIDMENKYKTAHFIVDEIIFSRQEKTLKIVYK